LLTTEELQMHSIVAGQEWVADADASDLTLLADALQDAVDAKTTGRIIGPAVDEVALRRVQRRAFRADLARQMRAATVDGAA
jgi:hypothetical protein